MNKLVYKKKLGENRVVTRSSHHKYDNNAQILYESKLITQVNLAFKSPSAPADLITGLSENGWKFFKGLEEIRSK